MCMCVCVCVFVCVCGKPNIRNFFKTQKGFLEKKSKPQKPFLSFEKKKK